MLDGRPRKALNAVCAVVALSAIGLVGWIAHTRNEAARSVPFSGPFAPSRTAQWQAFRAENEGNGPAAEDFYRVALQTRPYEARLKLGLARTYAAYGPRRKAWDLYEALVRSSDPSLSADLDALAWYADLTSQFGSVQEAMRIARRACGQGWMGKQRKGKELLAEAHLWAAIPSSSVPLRSATRHALRAVELDPSSVGAHLQVASLLILEQREDEAKTVIAQARSLATRGTKEDWGMLARFYHDQKRPSDLKESIAEFTRRFSSNDASGWLSLFNLTSSLDVPVPSSSFDKGFAPYLQSLRHVALERALRAVRPSDASTLIGIAEGVSSSNPDKAKSLAAAASRAASATNPLLYAKIARVLAQQGQKARALSMLREAMRHADSQDREQIGWSLDLLEDRAPKRSGDVTVAALQTLPYGL